MTHDQFRKLQEGDIIKSPIEQEAYIVTGHYGNHFTAVRTLDVTNYQEWELVKKQRNDEGGRTLGG